MKKLLFSIVFVVLLLSGCGENAQGIYYPARSSRFLGNMLNAGSACYADVSYLQYHDRLYTRTQKYMEFSKNALPLDKLSGKELCTIYGNKTLYWSEDKEQLAEVTTTGTLYQITAYDEAFRVCLYFEQPANVSAGMGPIYSLYIFECTNDIQLHTGEDYYSGLYHFPENASFDDLSPEDPEVSAFVDALLEAEFIDPAQEELPVFDFNRDNTYYLSFTDSLGLTGSFAIYEDGYVVDPADHNFILKLDPALCTAVMDKLPSSEWPGKYLYNTYDFDGSVRTQQYYQLDITETDTHLTFDLLVKETRVPLIEDSLDSLIAIGPAGSITLAKSELESNRIISFVLQPQPFDAPEITAFVELKKGLQDDMIYLRYGNSKEDTAQKDYIILNKQ